MCLKKYEMLWEISWFKNNVKNTHGVILLLVQLQGEACIFVKSKTPPWVFFHVF